MKRRYFLRSAVMGTGLLGMGAFPYTMYAGDRKKFAHDRVFLGNTGIEVSRMAMGTGTNGWEGSSNQTRKLGIKGLADLLRAAYDEGITFIDSADQYGTHLHIRDALKKIPREDLVILTKTTSRTANDLIKDLDRFRQEIGTDYIDIVLLHAETAGDWNVSHKEGMEVLAEAKENGILRAHGVSCHSLAALETAAKDPWAEVTFARFNPGRSRMDGSIPAVRNVLESFGKQNKGLVQMKVYGGGELVRKKDECLQFGMAHSFLHAFTLGIESHSQLVDVLTRLPDASVRG
jgi:aryl-alcohol dehydrogenase-like predicted oxidoreductase